MFKLKLLIVNGMIRRPCKVRWRTSKVSRWQTRSWLLVKVKVHRSRQSWRWNPTRSSLEISQILHSENIKSIDLRITIKWTVLQLLFSEVDLHYDCMIWILIFCYINQTKINTYYIEDLDCLNSQQQVQFYLHCPGGK